MILQMVWNEINECVRFGGYVKIQVRYKILRLEILKKALIFAQSALLSKGLF